MGNIMVLALLLLILVELGFSVSVTYDSKALVIDGRKRILQSGSIHYPRATPEVSLILLYVCIMI